MLKRNGLAKKYITERYNTLLQIPRIFRHDYIFYLQFFVFHGEVLTGFRYSFKKQLPKVFYKKRCFQTFSSIDGKKIVLESLFNKFTGLQAGSFITKRL